MACANFSQQKSLWSRDLTTYSRSKEFIGEEQKIYINIKKAQNLRSRLDHLKEMLQSTQNLHTIDLLGLSFDHSRSYIEYLFMQGMTWNNIRLDHVPSLSSFNLPVLELFEVAAPYTNIYPLLKKDNLTNGSKSDDQTLMKPEERVNKYHRSRTI